jgi:N-ethylmaleimide reductase
MSIADIKETIADHVHAAKCAIEAGFDGVEIVCLFSTSPTELVLTKHDGKTSANGYLCDQFLNGNTNFRTDDYGGSIANRSRFTLELLDAVAAEIGASKTAVRFSPFGVVLMPLDSDPIALSTHVVSEVEKRGLAYVCLTHPRTDLFLAESRKWEVLNSAVKSGEIKVKKEDIHLRHFTKILQKTPRFATGNYTDKNCFEEVENGDLDAITFARWFISNPDLVEKLRNGWDLTLCDLATFYADGAMGYVDYPVGPPVKRG